MPGSETCARNLLVLGGARSGKSCYAQRIAESSGLRPVLIATAKASDPEMEERIRLHSAVRGAQWTVIEESSALVGALWREACEDRIIVVDCLTLWLSKILVDNGDAASATRQLGQSVAGLPGPVIFISNEVGSGIVPENDLARAFRDAQGFLNQALAEACDAAVLLVSGMALRLKPSAEPDFCFQSAGAAPSLQCREP